MKKLLILYFTIVCCGCIRRQPITDETFTALKGDTVLIDEDGTRIQVRDMTEYVSIKQSLNGPVTYAFMLAPGGGFAYNKDGTRSKVIYKEGLYTDSLHIWIEHDTLRLGQTFLADVWVGNPDYKVAVYRPYSKTFDSSSIPDDESITIEDICSEKGLRNFQGEITFGTGQIVPFEYTYLVIDSIKQRF